MGDLTLIESQSQSPAAPLTTQSRPLPFREDCWSEDATSTLVDAWGRRYMELNRGNLRQKDWQEVADAVNARHGHNKKARRTDVQCKNRIDTLKKKYKVEKARVTESNGTLTSSWPFFSRLDSLIGSAVAAGKKQLQQQQSPLMNMNTPSPPMAVPLLYRKPVGSTVTMMMPPVVLPQKRPLPLVDDSYFRRNYSAVAAAAAAAEEEGTEEEEDNQSEDLASSEDTGGGGGGRGGGERKGGDEMEGMRRLARAIERFGEIYERVEGEKQKQMIDLEKQRMQFAKDLEVQRMQLFMDTQVQLEKIKQAKRSGSDGSERSINSETPAQVIGIKIFIASQEVRALKPSQVGIQLQDSRNIRSIVST